MIKTPNGKNLMNLQEAVQWLLDNNALPFQCTANYVAGAEIGLGTIVNPSPAKVRVGSLIFFADSKVSTVIAITSNSFICSDEYNDLVDDVVYVSNVYLNGEGHLIVALSNGENVDAGLVKMISGLSINASQHLIASYNDGSTTDLGAIFSGNVNISGTLNATAITGDSIIETMTGYSFTIDTPALSGCSLEVTYAGVCKNGNKITFVVFGKFNKESNGSLVIDAFVQFGIPNAIGAKLYPYVISGTNVLEEKIVPFYDGIYSKTDNTVIFRKYSNTLVGLMMRTNDLTANTDYFFRYEATFLLSDNLAA